jgi:hypothetical protein
MKHDALIYTNRLELLFVVAAQVTTEFIKCGYFYIDSVVTKEILLESKTGFSYLVKVPEEYLDIKASGQFNVTLELVKNGNTRLSFLPVTSED